MVVTLCLEPPVGEIEFLRRKRKNTVTSLKYRIPRLQNPIVDDTPPPLTLILSSNSA